MSTWFRVHNDILDNPKLILIAESDRWRYLGLLSLKSQGVLDQFDGDKLDRVVAAKLRLTPAEWAETKRRLQEENLIDDIIQPVGWEDRQFKSDSAAERMRRYRERKKAEKEGDTGDGGSDVTVTSQGDGESDAPVTSRKRNCDGGVTPPDNRVQITDTDLTDTTDAYASGAAAPGAQPDPTLAQLALVYNHEDQETQLFKRGTRLLRRAGMDYQPARNLLQKLIGEVGQGRVMDAIITCLIEQPVEPKAYLIAVTRKQGAPVPMDWVPPAPCLSELAALGVPEDIPEKARDIFVLWFSENGVTHNNWAGLFVRWCQLDWERAEGSRTAYLQRLAASAGLEYQQAWREPA